MILDKWRPTEKEIDAMSLFMVAVKSQVQTHIELYKKKELKDGGHSLQAIKPHNIPPSQYNDDIPF